MKQSNPVNHWLYGVDKRKYRIKKETSCSKCLHSKVCGCDVEKRCKNYVFGTSAGKGCTSCLLRFTRFDKDKVPCFICFEFLER